MTEWHGEHEPPIRMPVQDDVRQQAHSHCGRIDSQHLLGCGREIIVVHAGAEYRLRQTRNGGLLLTK